MSAEQSAEPGDLVWKSPPPRTAPRWSAVAELLMARPGEWALLESGPVKAFPWWGPLHQRDGFETRFVQHEAGRFLGPRDVYVRYSPGVGA